MKQTLLISLMIGLALPKLTIAAHFKLLDSKKKQVVTKKRPKDKNSLYRKLLKSNKELKAILKQRSEVPLIWDGTKKILTGKVYQGLLLNAVNSTNIESPILVRVNKDQGLPAGTLFSCIGQTKHKRVQTTCNRMITQNKEVLVSTSLLNLDGSAGLTGIYKDGKEELIAGIITSEIASGFLNTAQTKVNGALNSYPESTLKNQVLSGLIRGGASTKDILLEEMKTTEPIITIPVGKKVLIYFKEALYEY
jgi:hypothetical protein